MTKKLPSRQVTASSSLSSSRSKRSAHTHDSPPTAIVVAKEALEPVYPYCQIPPHFFERALYLQQKNAGNPNFAPRTLFSVQTWDGRDVMAFTED